MRGLRWEPAVYLYALNAAVALAVAFGLPLTDTQTAAVTTIVTAVLGGVAAFLTRPVEVSAATGALATALTAASALGLHLPAGATGTVATGLSAVLALLLRQHVTPAAAMPPPPLGTAVVQQPAGGSH